jgi:hypothetical protein
MNTAQFKVHARIEATSDKLAQPDVLALSHAVVTLQLIISDMHVLPLTDRADR